MSTFVVEPASVSISLLGTTLDEDGMVSNTVVAASIKEVLMALHEAVVQHKVSPNAALPIL